MRLYNNKKTIFLYVSAAFLFVVVFIYIPIIQNFAYSLYQWSSFSKEKVFVGFKYYYRLFEDPIFYTALKNNALYAVISIFCQVFIGLVIASILEDKVMRKFQTFFRTIFFLPSVISITVVGLLWQLIYDPNIGIVNNFLMTVGLNDWTHAWLGESTTAMLSVIFVSQWQYTGYISLLFLIAIQKIPAELYEAAMIDGASKIQTFFYITLPQVKNMVLVTSTITVIGAFKVFDEVYIMTGGGPGNATEVLASYMYRVGFRNDEMGYAAAIATVVFVITFTLTMLQFKIAAFEHIPRSRTESKLSGFFGRIQLKQKQKRTSTPGFGQLGSHIIEPQNDE